MRPLKWAHAHSTAGQAGPSADRASQAPADGRVVRHGRRTLRPGPAPLPRRPGGADRRRRAPGPTSSTSAAAPASPPGSSRRPAARCSGSSPTRGWPTSRGAPGSSVEVATFEAWEPAGRMFDAVVAAPGLALGGPGRGRGQGGAGAAARRPAGGVLERVPAAARRRGRLRRGLPPGGARLAVRPPEQMTRPWTRYQRLYAKVADGIRRGGRVRRPGAVADSTGSSPTPGTSGWTRCPPTARFTRLPPDKLAEMLEGVGAAIDAMGGGFHDASTRRWRSPRHEADAA